MKSCNQSQITHNGAAPAHIGRKKDVVRPPIPVIEVAVEGPHSSVDRGEVEPLERPQGSGFEAPRAALAEMVPLFRTALGRLPPAGLTGLLFHVEQGEARGTCCFLLATSSSQAPGSAGCGRRCRGRSWGARTPCRARAASRPSRGWRGNSRRGRSRGCTCRARA